MQSGRVSSKIPITHLVPNTPRISWCVNWVFKSLGRDVKMRRQCLSGCGMLLIISVTIHTRPNYVRTHLVNHPTADCPARKPLVYQARPSLRPPPERLAFAGVGAERI